MGKAPEKQRIIGVDDDTFRPYDLQGIADRARVSGYDEATDPNAYSGLMDSYRDSYLGTLYRGITSNTVRGDAPKDWDPLADKYLPKGYESFADAFAYSTSPAQSQAIKEAIDARMANRARREKRSWGSTLISDLGAGILDPSNIVAGPMLKGVGAAKGFFMGGTFAAGVGVAQESVVATGDPTMTEGEGAVRIGGALVGGGVLGGAIGAGVGRWGAKAVAPAGASAVPPLPFRQVSKNQIVEHVLVDLEGGAAIAKWDKGNGGTTKWGFAQNSHPDIDVTKLTRGQAMERAKSQYWLPIMDKMDGAKAAVAFDAFFISGNKKLVARIAKARDAAEGLAIYRGFLNRLADKDPTKPRKGWMNRVNKLSQFIGAGGREPAGSTRYALNASTSPHVVDFKERGYIAVEDTPTGLRDQQGRPVLAAFVKTKNAPVDDMTTMPVHERADRFQTIEEQATPTVRPDGEPIEMTIRVGDEAEAPTSGTGVTRPRTRAMPDEEGPPAPRAINNETDAAIELDRLERGDAEAARRAARGPGREASQPSRFEMKPDGVRAEAGQRIQHRSGAGLKIDVVLGVMTRPDGVEVYRVKRGSIEGYVPVDQTRLLPETDNLPFSTAGTMLSVEDGAFMMDVVAVKGFSKLTQPELNRLRDVIVQLADIDPEAARLWMGKAWDGKVPTKGQVTKRLNALVAHRNGLNEKVPGYKRDAEGFERDALRDSYDRAIDLHVARLDEIDSEIDGLKIDRQRDLDELDDGNPALRNAIWADYDQALDAQIERARLVRERLQKLYRDRSKDFGRRETPMTLNEEVAERLARKDQDDAEFDGLARMDNERTTEGNASPEDLVKMKEKDGLWYRQRREMGLPDERAGYTYGTAEVLRDVAELLNAKQELLLRIENNATTYVGRGETVVNYSRKQVETKQKIEAEMNDLLNFRYKIQALHDELDDLLPFGVNGKIVGDPGVGGSIKIDVNAILDSYKEKPWRQPIDGVEPLSDDLFPTPESWVNFIYFHEREHVLNKRLPDETLGEYETRINNRAIDALRGEQAPWKPVDGWKNELALRPTPIGQLMQMVKNPANYIWESIARLASDYDLRLQRNTVAGGASNPGGSVYQRAMRHTARAADYYNVLENLYLVYARGRGTDGGPIVRGTTVWNNSRKAKKQGKLTFEDFDREVGKAQASGKASDIPEVNQAAKLFNDIVEDMRKQENDLGLLPGKASVERELKQTRASIDRLERTASSPEAEEMLARWKARVPVLEMQLKNNVDLPGKKSLPYFTRLWDVGAMMKDPERIKGILAEGFIREGNDPATAKVKALEAYEGLIADPASQSIEVAKTIGEFKSRDLPVENDEVIDFIHTDASLIMHRYMRRTGAAIEMTRAFGDPSGDMEADRVLAGLAAEGMTPQQQQAAMQIWYDARDRIVGAFHGENPMSMSNRMVRGLKRWTRFAVMGMSGITQFTDFARAAWIVGYKSLAKGAFAPLFSQMMAKDPGKYAHAVGEALDFEIGLLSRRAMDDDDWTFRVKESGIERLMGDLEVPFFVLNGVTPLTSILKRAVARATPHLVLDRARKVADAVRNGREVPQTEATWLREHGIDEHDAMLLVDLPVEESKGGFIMADLDAWGQLGSKGERGVNLMYGVISGNVRRSVATPGPLNRPRILDGIMIDKKEQAKAWEDRWVAEKAEADARELVINLRKAGFERGDPDFDDAVEALKEATGVHTRARLNVGVKGRKERPFRSLPFQLQSFSFAQTGKFVSSVLNGRDQGVLRGFLGLWGAGIVASWLKAKVSSFGQDDNSTVDEHLYRGLMSTGFLTWMSIPVDAAKGIARYAMADSRMEEMLSNAGLVDADRPGLGDNAMALGPTLGLGINGLEAAFGTGFDGQDLPPSDRVYQLRRMLPFGNLLYFNWLMRMGFGALTDEAEGGGGAGGGGGGGAPTEGLAEPDEYSRFQEMLGGFTVGDTDPREIPKVELPEPKEIEELESMEAGDVIARVMATKQSKRPRRPPAIPLALQYAN